MTLTIPTPRIPLLACDCMAHTPMRIRTIRCDD